MQYKQKVSTQHGVDYAAQPADCFTRYEENYQEIEERLQVVIKRHHMHLIGQSSPRNL
jgi:hypothetical protein